ncbi:MAG: hypothetical protein ACRC1M_00465 [Methanobacteriaceae archaeon]
MKIKMNEVVELMKKVGLNKVELNGLFLEVKESGMVSTNALIEGFESLYELVYNMLCANTIKENDLTPASERYFSEETVCVNEIYVEEAPVVTVVEEVAVVVVEEAPVVTVVEEVAVVVVEEAPVVTVVEEVVTIENKSSLSDMFYTDACRKHTVDGLTSMLFVRPGQCNQIL